MNNTNIEPSSLYRDFNNKVFFIYGSCENTETGQTMVSYTSTDSTPTCVKAYVTPVDKFNMTKLSKSEISEFIRSLPDELSIYYKHLNVQEQ